LRRADIGELDLGGGVAAAEERGGVGAGAEEGAFEPFNLDAEREAGDFDEHGNYTERKQPKDEADAWLEGVEVDERMADKCRREAEAEASKPEARCGVRARALHARRALLTARRRCGCPCAQKMSDAELARMKLEIAGLLQPVRCARARAPACESLQLALSGGCRAAQGETVLRALKRMGGGGGGGGGAGRGRGAVARPAVAPEQRAAFERLTELSSLLMAFGEYDVYTFAKESFEREARALAPPAAGSVFERPVRSFAAAPADEDDMFADAPPAKRPNTGAPAAAQAPAAAAAAPLDFAPWSTAQLRRFLDARGAADAARGATEKGELVAAAAAAAREQQLALPPGDYAWQPSSGLYTSAAAGLGFDLATGGFCDAAGAWYAWDAASGAFVPWPQQA
jgi:CD2 antigen cytoplasmic tail-binding protein 2